MTLLKSYCRVAKLAIITLNVALQTVPVEALQAVSSSVQEARGANATTTEPHIELIGVETRSSKSILPCKGMPGWNITNIAAGTPWNGWLGRVETFRDGLANISARNPRQMVILVDVSDMMFGGCSNSELMQHYDFAAQHGGAQVVFGATVYLQPHRLVNEYKQFEDRRKRVLDAAGMPMDAYCKDKEILRSLGESLGYAYLNAGFVMGPAGKVLDVFEGMLSKSEEVTRRNGKFDDQMAANMFMMENHDKATLDYTGRLVLTEDGDVIKCHGEKLWLEVKSDHLVNTRTGTTACFVHGAGGGWRHFMNYSFWPKH